MTMERQVVTGADGQPKYGLNATIRIRRHSSRHWESFNYFWSNYAVPFLAMIQITAAAVVLVLSKQERPHVPLRVWIVGCLCGAVATLALFAWYYFYSERHSDLVATYGLDAILDGDSPVTGRDRRLIVFYARAETPLGYFKLALTCFAWVWFILGCVWIWNGISFRSDAPQLYWLCVAFAILGGIGCVTQLLIFAAGCYYC